MKFKKKGKQAKKSHNAFDDSDNDVGDIFTDEINDFTESRNKVDFESKGGESEDDEELFGLLNDEGDSDEEINAWDKRLKQIKFNRRLEKNKALPGDGPEKSWGNKRTMFYGGVNRKPRQAASDEEDEWTMEEKEIDKLQKKLDEEIDEDDFLLPSLAKKATTEEQTADLTIKRDLTAHEKEVFLKTAHPEVEPLKEELNHCLEELENLKNKKNWKYESRETCFRLLAACIAFYLHLIESEEDCRGHPVIKRIVQLKRLAKMYEALSEEQMMVSDDSETGDLDSSVDLPRKHPRLDTSNIEDDEEDDDDVEQNKEEDGEDGEMKEIENRPITYEIAKNKQKKKTAPNNPRVKNREKFRKAKIRRKGKYRDYRPEVNKYQGEASGIRVGVIRSTKLK